MEIERTITNSEVDGMVEKDGVNSKKVTCIEIKI